MFPERPRPQPRRSWLQTTNPALIQQVGVSAVSLVSAAGKRAAMMIHLGEPERRTGHDLAHPHENWTEKRGAARTKKRGRTGSFCTKSAN